MQKYVYHGAEGNIYRLVTLSSETVTIERERFDGTVGRYSAPSASVTLANGLYEYMGKRALFIDGNLLGIEE